jgi:hypothetical protein
MSKIHNINTGIIAEWISLIDPKMTKDLQYEEKIASVLRAQSDLLLNSSMTEIRAKHWILTKRVSEKGTEIEFALIAYKVKTYFPFYGESEFNLRQLKRIRKKLELAIEEENYLKAAKLRDQLKELENEGPAVA